MIAREMFESSLRDLIWQAAEDLGAEDATRMVNALLAEYHQELATFAAEQGLVVSKPERAL